MHDLLQVGPGGAEQVGHPVGELGRLGKRSTDHITLRRESGHQLLQQVDAGVKALLVVLDGADHRVQVVDHVADQLIAVGQRIGELGGAL